MPKGQFNDTQKVIDGRLNARGGLEEDAQRLRASRPQHLHCVLVQGDTVSAGLTELQPGATEWSSQETGENALTDGPAHAAGVIITIRPRESGREPLVEAFTWSQPVTLEVG